MAIDVRQLQARGIYEGRLQLQTLLADLDQIGKLLENIASFKKRLRLFAAVSALVGLASVIAAATKALLGVLGIFAFAFAGALFIYSFVYGHRLHRGGDRLVMIKDLSRAFQTDTDPRAPFSLRLALASQPKLVREEGWAARTSGKQKFFEEEFLSLEGALMDGTVLAETVTELTRKRTHKNPRGKIKTKTRNRYLVTLRFAYPTDVYGDAQAASSALHEEILVPESATLRDRRVTEKAIVVKAVADQKADVVQTSAMLSLGAYRILNLARRLAAGGPGGRP